MQVVLMQYIRNYGIVQVLTLAATYAVTAWLGLWLAIPPGYATAIWPASGLASGHSWSISGRRGT